MPVVNTTQARVELSSKQVKAFIDTIHAHFAEPDQMVMVYIEETNLGSTLVVGGNGMPMTLITHLGETTALGEKPKRK